MMITNQLHDIRAHVPASHESLALNQQMDSQPGTLDVTPSSQLLSKGPACHPR